MLTRRHSLRKFSWKTGPGFSGDTISSSIYRIEAGGKYFLGASEVSKRSFGGPDLFVRLVIAMRKKVNEFISAYCVDTAAVRQVSMFIADP